MSLFLNKFIQIQGPDNIEVNAGGIQANVQVTLNVIYWAKGSVQVETQFIQYWRYPMNRLTDIQEISKHSKLIYKNPQNISRKFEKNSSSRTEDIMDYLSSVRKWGNEQTDIHTRKPKLFRNSVQTSKECLQKIQDWWLIHFWWYTMLTSFQ